jgi:hypothetical protein
MAVLEREIIAARGHCNSKVWKSHHNEEWASKNFSCVISHSRSIDSACSKRQIVVHPQSIPTCKSAVSLALSIRTSLRAITMNSVSLALSLSISGSPHADEADYFPTATHPPKSHQSFIKRLKRLG